MRFPSALAAVVLSLASQAAAKAAFAHFMMGNSGGFTSTDWNKEMLDAIAAGIDGFALNMAYDEDTTKNQMAAAFASANTLGFKLIFSFDYAGNGPWPKAEVTSMIQTWGASGAYFKHGGSKPLVSTFEGPGQSDDWKDIKAATNCYFMPSWSSLGAMRALQKDTADGLFNWAAWPTGRTVMDTYTDASYIQFLGQKFGEESARSRYMMPVSPWFYTNLPQYNKNWMWASGDLWYTRWQQVLDVDPEYVQIISWNDYGESHYIGGVRQSPPFEHPANLYDYVSGMSHDGWRRTLPAWISLWKKGTTTVSREEVVVWYLLHEDGGCNAADTTVNTATHIQIERPAGSIAGSGNVFFDAVLTGPADVTVKFGGRTEMAYFTNGPAKGAGVYHGAQYVERAGGQTGPVTVELSRNGKVFLSVMGVPMGGCGPGGFRNFNPYVASAGVAASSSVTSSPAIADQKCISGGGVGVIDGLCRMTCGMGYCPLGACVCTARGILGTLPEDNFVYTKGFYYPDACDTKEHPIVEPEVSPFLATVCSAGVANDPSDPATRELCPFACKYGHCPIKVCTCTATGTLKEIQSEHSIRDGVQGFASMAVIDSHSGHIAINNMCAFTCPYGFCPTSGCRVYVEGGGDGSPPIIPGEGTDYPPQACPDRNYKDLESLHDDLDNILAHCGAQYVLEISMGLLDHQVKRFNDIMADGYDKYFDVYANYVSKSAYAVLKEFMKRQSDRYFTCEIMEEIFCCPGCEFMGYDCRYCQRGDDVCKLNGNFPGPGSGSLPSKFEKKSQPCPPQYQERGQGDVNRQSIYWTLRKDKENDFFADVENATGARKEFVTWSPRIAVEDIPASCIGQVGSTMADKCYDQNHWFNAPLIKGFTKDEVPNPSTEIQKVIDTMGSLRTVIAARRFEMMSGTYVVFGDDNDLVDAIVLPIIMLEVSLAGMESVVEKAKEINEANTKDIVLNMLNWFFTLVGLYGGGAMTTALGRVMAVLGEVGGLALAIEGVVSDPSSSIMLIFAVFQSVGTLRDVGAAVKAQDDAIAVAKATKAQRSMTSEDIKKIGGDDMVKKVGQVRDVTNMAAKGTCSRYT